MWVLRSGYVNPDYYSGGTHQLRGEKVPNTVSVSDKAKLYESSDKAEKQANRLNEKYSGDYYFYVEEVK
jgi:hypothetical protein